LDTPGKKVIACGAEGKVGVSKWIAPVPSEEMVDQSSSYLMVISPVA
jgi:hypothetical protein